MAPVDWPPPLAQPPGDGEALTQLTCVDEGSLQKLCLWGRLSIKAMKSPVDVHAFNNGGVARLVHQELAWARRCHSL